MRSYVRNTKSADAVVPMVLDKTNACQRNDCEDVSEGHHSALSRQELEKIDLKLCLFQVRFSSPTLDIDMIINFDSAVQCALVSCKRVATLSPLAA